MSKIPMFPIKFAIFASILGVGEGFKDFGNRDNIDDLKSHSGSGYLNETGPFVVFMCIGYSIQIKKSYNSNTTQIRSWVKDTNSWTPWSTISIT